ncbi:DNA-directed DNA polymerase [Alteripontixanthobacter maritimus]|uniref:DNA-directed DNA polymerase n=1 Tax=Alteripontixanthobacter maritimus TaxID=2161824 RepID=A0A369Q9H2_9SPHN|nr:3'-5' exonuclease [Alteripontixanthobacter maritimus]RDC61354.1 DNA-directed DNA polymerase [Alteripontixanthobacter maritimus]
MTDKLHQYDSDVLLELLEQDERYKVLRAVPRSYTDMPEDGCPPDGRCIAILDCETTGLDIENDKLIELAIMLIFVDNDGKVLRHMGPVSWLEDPQVVIDPKITLLTGLAAHHLVGKQINDEMASALIDRADICLAHNAAFDSKWIEQRYPEHRGKAWACSLAEIDWLTLGYEGRAQQHLLVQHGWFSNAHRAGDDVWSLFHLLRQQQAGPGSHPMYTHLQRLLTTSATSTVRVEAVNAPYAAKNRLKARQYRWNPDRKLWTKELAQNDLAAERSWYRTEGLPMFRTVPITAHERHR